MCIGLRCNKNDHLKIIRNDGYFFFFLFTKKSITQLPRQFYL